MLINSPQEMFEYGKSLSQKHKVLLLHGDLAAGKTVLTKGFVEGLGLNPDLVQSPTYTYINIYDNKILHIDMYRLEKFDDMVEKGILDHISNFEYIIIERPKFEDKLDLDTYLKLQIDKLPENKREISII